jgi:methylmalonyl-CoA/ethylmalonyl-CoA epimerase
MLLRIDHVGIACRSLDAAVERYTSVFGLTVVSQEVNAEQGVREAMLCFPGGATPRDPPAHGGTAHPPVPPGPPAHGGTAHPPVPPGPPAYGGTSVFASYVQLLEPLGDDTPVGRFLARRGEGIHHVGYAVPDVAAALETFGGRGVRLIDERPRHGSMGASIAFLHPADLGGVLTELVQPRAAGETLCPG